MTAPWQLAKRILIVVILIWGVLAVLVRLAAPLLEHAREPLAEWLSETSDQTIQIGRLSADWYGLGPRLHLQNISVGSGEQPVTLRKAMLELAPTGLFAASPLNALRLTLTGLDLNVQREANGQVHVVGLPAVNFASSGDSNAPLALPSRLRLYDIRVNWQDLRARNARPLHIDDLYLDLQRDGDRLSVSARLDSDLGQARLVADVVGSLQQTDWSGNTYLQVRGIQLARLFSAYMPPHYRVDSGELDLQLWQEWVEATPLDSRGSLNLTKARLAAVGKHEHQVAYEQISGDFQFNRINGSQWQLQVEHLQVAAADEARWPSGRIAAQRSNVEGAPRFAIAADHLVLDDLTRLLLIRAPSPELGEALRKLQPRGRVHDLRVRLPLEQDAEWAASARLEGLAINTWQQIPGVSNVDGRIAASAQHSSLVLDTREAPIDYSSLFRYPLHASRLLGTVHFQQHLDGWELLTDELQLDTPDLHSTSRFSLRQRKEQPLHLDLITRLQDGDAAATPKYLPTAIMSEKLVTWLDSALSEGRVEKATALLSGPLDTFPYHKQRNGVFEVEALIHDAPLHYREGWPPLEEISALLRFHEYSMDITLLKGRVYNSPIRHLQARIDSLGPTTPLHITGQLAGPLKDQLAVLKEDALRKKFGHIAEALAVQGDAELTLDFEVPLSDLGKYRLDGSLLFKNARMSLPGWDLNIDDINGELAINLDSLSASSILGRTLGAPLNVSVTPQANSNTRVSTRVHLDKKALARQLPQLPMQLLEGSADFKIDLDIPGVSAKAGTPTWLTVSSDLEGMLVDIPPPLGKTTDQHRELRVRLPLAGSSEHATQIEFDGKLSAAIAADGQRADIRYQRGTASMPIEPGYKLQVKLAELDLSVWQALVGKLNSQDTPSPTWEADIETERLLLNDILLQQAKLDLQGNNDAIEGNVLSKQLGGWFSYPMAEGQPLVAKLQKAYLSYDTDSEGTAQPPKPAEEPDPRQLPPIQVSCADLRVNQAELGKARLQTTATPLGMRIEQFSFDGPHGKLDATGAWMWRKGTQHSELNGAISSPDLGVLLQKLGYPRHMHDASAQAGFRLDWPGHPGQIHKVSLGGTLDVNIGKGRLAEVDPGVTRVLSLLSVDALTRRLKFDFGDLLKEGYSFDRITGSFRFSDGSAHSNDLLVNGPTGNIEIGGRIGLVDHELEQLVSVTPKLDATLPIISTLAGGPIAGIAALLAQELMSDEVDQINRFEYSVSGTWDEPKLTALDSGGGLSRLVNTLKGEETETKTPQQEELIQRPEAQKRGPLKRLLDVLPKGRQEPPGEENDSLLDP